jgi:hypothetical protein
MINDELVRKTYLAQACRGGQFRPVPGHLLCEND